MCARNIIVRSRFLGEFLGPFDHLAEGDPKKSSELPTIAAAKVSMTTNLQPSLLTFSIFRTAFSNRVGGGFGVLQNAARAPLTNAQSRRLTKDLVIGPHRPISQVVALHRHIDDCSVGSSLPINDAPRAMAWDSPIAKVVFPAPPLPARITTPLLGISRSTNIGIRS